MLHIINTSTLLNTCLSIKTADDSLLLIEDAVTAMPLLAKITYVYALQEDIQTRGLINHVPKHINLVDYAGFVELVVKHSPAQSWY
jgi:tRNA 2-thiouridine synthesizing protein B